MKQSVPLAEGSADDAPQTFVRKPGGAPQKKSEGSCLLVFYKTTQQLHALEVIEREKKIGSPQGPNYKAYLGKNATPTSHAPFLKGTVRSQLDIQLCVCVYSDLRKSMCVWAMKSKHSLDQADGSFQEILVCVCSGSGAGNTRVCVCIVISGNPCVCGP